MHENLNELMQTIVSMDYHQLLARARTSLKDACNIFSSYTEKEQASRYVISFLSAVIAADGQFTDTEQRFICDLFGEDFMQSFLENGDKIDADTIDRIVDSLSAPDKMSLCLFAAFIIAVDGHVNISEYDYLKKLVE